MKPQTLRAISTRAAHLLAALLLSGPAGAATLTVMPQSPSVLVDDTIVVDVVASGLGAGAPPSLGGCVFSLAYDPAVVDFAGVGFGPELGALDTDPTPETSPGADTSTFVFWNPGDVRVIHFAIPGGPPLDPLQGSSFTLASFTLRGIAPGETPLSLASLECADAGDPVSLLAVTAVDGEVETLPEPGVLALASGAALVAVLRRRRAADHASGRI
jgi:hypothetical protein